MRSSYSRYAAKYGRGEALLGAFLGAVVGLALKGAVVGAVCYLLEVPNNIGWALWILA